MAIVRMIGKCTSPTERADRRSRKHGFRGTFEIGRGTGAGDANRSLHRTLCEHSSMFSGLVEARGSVTELTPEGPGMRIRIGRPPELTDVALGDSIAVNGCCLTVVAVDADWFEFQAGAETLSRTTMGSWKRGAPVNLERALAVGDRLGGHLVTGHIDGLGRLAERRDHADWSDMWFDAPRPLLRQMASKGSIAVDGVSLTLVEVTDSQFSVALIPHTMTATTLGDLRRGDAVNLETDLLAKYVQRQLETRDWSV